MRCLQVARMAVDTKAPGQAPPDLPSLLLDGRICYIGMPVSARAAAGGSCDMLWFGCGTSAAVLCQHGGGATTRPLVLLVPVLRQGCFPRCSCLQALITSQTAAGAWRDGAGHGAADVGCRCGHPNEPSVVPPTVSWLQLVPAVTELVISELLWLNYSAPEKPVYLYINSTGGWAGQPARNPCSASLQSRCGCCWCAEAVGS